MGYLRPKRKDLKFINEFLLRMLKYSTSMERIKIILLRAGFIKSIVRAILNLCKFSQES